MQSLQSDLCALRHLHRQVSELLLTRGHTTSDLVKVLRTAKGPDGVATPDRGVDSCSHNVIDGDGGCIVCGSKTAKKSDSAKIRPHFHAAFLTNAASGNRGKKRRPADRGDSISPPSTAAAGASSGQHAARRLNMPEDPGEGPALTGSQEEVISSYKAIKALGGDSAGANIRQNMRATVLALDPGRDPVPVSTDAVTSVNPNALRRMRYAACAGPSTVARQNGVNQYVAYCHDFCVAEQQSGAPGTTDLNN